jgi:Tfp pilus assembly protein PilX
MTSARTRPSRATLHRQRGVALFFALICMVAIMLAAVMLVRSVDTATLIAGNLAFQQSTTRSGDGGTEAAIVYLAGVEAANSGTNVLTNPLHPFNVDNAGAGYYASLDPSICLTGTCTGTPPPNPLNRTAYVNFSWTAGNAVSLAPDASGNTVQYIIQRMCRTSGVAVNDPSAQCLFSSALVDNNKQNIPLPQEICSGPGCPAAGQTPQLRVTTRVQGPKNTLSYLQTIVY